MVEYHRKVEVKSAERLAFAHYLRTGQRLSESAFARRGARAQAKFNPYHDPSDDRFTFAPSGTRLARASPIPERRRPPQSATTAPRATSAPPIAASFLSLPVN